MTSLAARTREAVRDNPFLYDALRAGVVNYTACARYLAVEGENEAIATALRRYADELPEGPQMGAEARVSMESGVGPTEDGDGALLSIGDTAFASDSGSMTAILVAGDVSPRLLGQVLGRLVATDVAVEAAGVGSESIVAVVERRAGADALRAVESAVDGPD